MARRKKPMSPQQRGAETRRRNQEARLREERARRIPRGVPDIPDGPVRHAPGCFIENELHLGDCLVDA